MRTSSRNHPLMWCGYDLGFNGKVLTVEMAYKWYFLSLVDVLTNEVTEIGFDELDVQGHGFTPFVDHAPNPKAVDWLCEKNGWTFDPLAEELITGRWEIEVKP